MAKVSYLRSSSGTITLYHTSLVTGKSKVHNIDKSNPNYNKIADIVLKDGDVSLLDELLEVAKTIERKVASVSGAEGVQVSNGQVFYQGEVLHNAVVSKILEFIAEGYDFTALVNFLNNLMQNPSKASIDNLYRFLEYNKMPITPDGCFLAYKAVEHDYKDCHSKTFDNSPGQTVKMPRWKVQDDPSVTCSYGLHVAALDYVKNSGYYGGKRVVLVKVNPRDVVSVPTDYNNQKMRVCEYVVVEDFKQEVQQADVVDKETPTQTQGATTVPEDDNDNDYDALNDNYDDEDFDDEDDDFDDGLDDDYEDDEFDDEDDDDFDDEDEDEDDDDDGR